GDSNGDPHLLTFDGQRYDLQAVGEFVAARAAGTGFQVQVRQQPFPGSRLVAVNTAIAMDVAGDRVQVDLSGSTFTIEVGGRPSAAPATLPHGGALALSAEALRPVLTVTWPDGSSAKVTAIGSWGLHLIVAPAP